MSDLIEILEKHKVKFIKANDPSEIKLQCTSGLHEDNTPSLQYNLDKNIFHCWSCGFKGSASQLLRSLGIKISIPIESKQPYKIQKLKNKLESIQEVKEILLPEDKFPAVGSLRNIKDTTVEEFGGFFTEKYNFDHYICFPIYQNNKLRFIEGKLTLKNSKLSKYRRYPKNTITTDILFPLDKIHYKNHVILVEGLLDMMNLWQLGYKNTLCVFGSTNFSYKKVNVLESISCVKVTIMFDGDMAGRNGAQKISNLLEKRDIETDIINLPEGKDPGDLTAAEAEYFLNARL